MGDRCPRASKPPLKKRNNGAYNLKYKGLQLKRAVLLGELDEAERLLARHSERQRCLLDLVLHQQLVLELLHGDLMYALAAQAADDNSLGCAWPTAAAAASAAASQPFFVPQGSSSSQQECRSSPQPQPLQGGGMLSSTALQMLSCSDISCHPRHKQQQQQQLPEPMDASQQDELTTAAAASSMDASGTAATAGISSSSGSCSQLVANSYTADLLRAATPAQIRSVTSKTADTWREQCYELFMRLVVLLELVNRSAEAAQDATSMPATEPPAAAAAAAAAAAPPEAPAAAVPEPFDKAVSHDSQAALQLLEQLVDAQMQQVVIAYMFNHVPLLEACTTDYATWQVSAPQPGHWQVSEISTAECLNWCCWTQFDPNVCTTDYATWQVSAPQPGHCR
jgi:hypothetical protein